MLITPLLLLLYDRFLTLDCGVRPKDTIKENNSVIIAGFGRFGQIVGRVLLAKGITATLIDNNPNQVDLMRSFGWRWRSGFLITRKIPLGLAWRCLSLTKRSHGRLPPNIMTR